MATEITPTMTGNSAPSPYVASASSVYDGGGGYEQPYKAFDKKFGGDSWTAAAGYPQWLKLDLGSSKVVNRYAITCQAGQQDRAPKDFTFEGSNDDSSWTTLDTKTGITFSSGESKEFSFVNTNAYRYYRIYVTANVSGLVEICEMYFYRVDTNNAAFLLFF